ncbi:MAG TPA: response regulator [Bryobacteraceae bacterium]|nr:response regulator [Bryobacteraceae bacterium]
MPINEDKRRQILVVEDEGLIAADIQRRLERLGYPMPAIASSGAEALQCARSTPFDLVLMDIRLKGDMDGIATAHRLKSELDTPVVYITAHADNETIERAKLTEPLGYILKPITDGDLRSAVQIALYKAEMERRLRTSEAWLSTTLRSVGEGIIATDTTGEIVCMNPVAECLTGWSAADAFGSQLMDVLGLLEESQSQPAKNPIFDLFAGECRSYTLVSKTGVHKTVEVECSENCSESDLLGSIVVVRDISRRKEMEGCLIQSQRMEAVANLAGGLAHDFNNQLTVILGYAEELCERLSGDEQEQAREIQQAASIAGSITAQLLTLSRRDIPRLEVVNINEVIGEVQPLLSRSLGKGRTLATELGSPLGFVRGDRNQIKQVLMNLALNARDAMPSGGELRLESSTLEVDAESPAARIHHPGPYVRLLVTDTGAGMDQATLARVFEPLFTTKAAGFGTGLGLSIVHSIIVKNGGYIQARSEIGKGTSFEILFPCVGTFQRLGDISSSEHAAGESDGPTVLLVEDEDSVRRMMHKFLEREGYQLLEARSGQEAKDLAEVYGSPIDVLVTDVVMPGMTGPELAERLAPLRPDMKVLFVSGYRHDTLEHQGLLKHDLNLLPKPFPAMELIRRVQILLNSVALVRP